VDECILYSNSTSFVVNTGYYSYAQGSYSGTVENSWLKDVTGNLEPSPGLVCTGNFWTLPEGSRTNLVNASFVNNLSDNPFPEGDVNDDGVTTQADAEMVMDYLIGKLTLGELPNAADADADGDSDIDMRDATLIRAFYEGLIWKFPR
jgi:hypothetical protein